MANRGFTLLSLLVSITILLIAFTMAASTVFSVTKLTRQAGEFTMAGNFAEGVMEDVQSRPFEQVKSMEVTAGLPRLRECRCFVTAKPAGDGLKTVTVVCSWRDGDRTRSVRFATLVAKGAAR